jgi:hypothetical protein
VIASRGRGTLSPHQARRRSRTRHDRTSPDSTAQPVIQERAKDRIRPVTNRPEQRTPEHATTVRYRHVRSVEPARGRASRTRVRRWDLAGWLGCLGWCEGVARRRLKFRAPSRTTGTEICRLPRPGGPEQRVRTRTGAIRAQNFDRCVLLRLRQRLRSGWLLRRRLRWRSSRWLIRDRTLPVLETGLASPPRVQASVEMRWRSVSK